MSEFRAASISNLSERILVEVEHDNQISICIFAGPCIDYSARISSPDAHRLADWLFKRGFGSTLSALTRLESEPAPLDDASTELEALRSRADTASDVLNFHRKRIENIEARLAKLEAP